MRAKSSTRRYDDACAAAHAMDILGDRWAMPVMRELMLGPRRFSDLRRSLPGVSANVLTMRLTGLEEAGVVQRRRLPPPAATQVYELTRWGYEARPVFQALGKWGVRSPSHDPTKPFSATSLALSLRTMLDPARLGDMEATIDFVIGEQGFRLILADGAAAIAPGGGDGSADAMLSGPAETIAAIVYAGLPIAEAQRDGEVTVAGDHDLVARFVTLFPMPDKAPLPA